jgi:hypothetical protein
LGGVGAERINRYRQKTQKERKWDRGGKEGRGTEYQYRMLK